MILFLIEYSIIFWMKLQKQIFLVEDDIVDQMMVKKAIRELGYNYEILCFINGEEVLDYLKRDTPPPFLILTDINMPKMNGIELIKEIQKDERLRIKSIPVVILSSSASDYDVKESFENCINGYFEKKMDYSGLISVMQKILEYWEECLQPTEKFQE